MIVEVTQEDIDRGLPDNCVFCPIAVALRRRGFEEPFARMTEILVGPPLDREYFKTPRAAVRFMRRFDKGLKVTPFRFKVNDKYAPIPNTDQEESTL